MLWDAWRKESFLCSHCLGTNVIDCYHLILAISAGVPLCCLFTNKNSSKTQLKITDQPWLHAKDFFARLGWAIPTEKVLFSISHQQLFSTFIHLQGTKWLILGPHHSLWITPARSWKFHALKPATQTFEDFKHKIPQNSTHPHTTLSFKLIFLNDLHSKLYPSWWFQPVWKILVKFYHFHR